MSATVSQLWRFPIKSMAGERLASARVTVETGVLGDRGHAVLDVAAGLPSEHPRRHGDDEGQAPALDRASLNQDGIGLYP